MCGICVLGKRFNNVNINRLSKEGKKKLDRNKKIYQNHIKIVENQKYMYNRIKNNLNEYDCILILDFKENFKLNYDKIEIGFDHFNKRQVSCLGVSCIFKDGNNLTTHYMTFFSDILNHDSLFASDCLEKVFNELNPNFTNIHIFTDCGPHFRSKEFIYRVKKLHWERNKLISLNYFAEYHGKSIVDGLFGRMSKLFRNMDM